MSTTNELVRFYKQHDQFNPGETAGYTPRDAHRLVMGGVAVYVTAPKGCGVDGVSDEDHTKDLEPEHFDETDPIYQIPNNEKFPAW